MLSITGVLFYLSLLNLVKLPSCPFILIIPQLNFHTLSMVRVFREITLWGILVLSSNLSWSYHINAIGYSTLHLLRRAFSSTTPVKDKKLLFTSLILPKLTYWSPILRPNLIKDIGMLERVQIRVTKFILNDYHSDYKSRLISLQILPLMYRLKLNDLMFFISSLKNPQSHYNTLDYFSFCDHPFGTRSSTHMKLKHSLSSTSLLHHSFFHRLPRIWNPLPQIDTSLSLPTIKKRT